MNFAQAWFSEYRSSHQRCSVRKGFLRTFAAPVQSLFWNKYAGLRPATLLKKRPWYRCFPVNFAKFLRAPFSQTPLVAASVNSTLMPNVVKTFRNSKKTSLMSEMSLIKWKITSNVILKASAMLQFRNNWSANTLVCLSKFASVFHYLIKLKFWSYLIVC